MCYSGEPLTVQVPGTQTRSFCYVSDMVYIILVSLLSVVILIQVLGVIDYDHIYAWNLLGWWTYTSNGRGKHWSNQHWEPRLYYNWIIWALIFLPNTNMCWYFIISGEFTMIELAENVKEVSCNLQTISILGESPHLPSVLVWLYFNCKLWTKVWTKELFDNELWTRFHERDFVCALQYAINDVMRDSVFLPCGLIMKLLVKNFEVS